MRLLDQILAKHVADPAAQVVDDEFCTLLDTVGKEMVASGVTTLRWEDGGIAFEAELLEDRTTIKFEDIDGGRPILTWIPGDEVNLRIHAPSGSKMGVHARALQALRNLTTP